MRQSGRPRLPSGGSFIVDGSGTILGFDMAMERLTGWPATDVVGHGKELSRAAAEHDRDPGLAHEVRPLYDGRIPLDPEEACLPLTFNRRDGRRIETEAAVRLLPGPGQRALVTVLRVLARSAARAATPDPPSIDELTGLAGPDAFRTILADEFDRAVAVARPLALIVADVDHLRDVNDRHGRAGGDEVLRKLAGILRVVVDDETRVARLNGDDFAILLPGSGRGEARQIAAALRSTVEQTRFFALDGELPQVTLSLGAASFPADAETHRDLVDRAVDALDEARSMGRNRVWCYLRRPRVPLQVPVYFDGADSLLVGYARDLSPSGIFVQTGGGIDVGMRCALTFPLPGHDGRVHAVGRVVRAVPPVVDPGEGVRVPGIGMEFERFGGPQDRRAIESFLHRNEGSTRRPEQGPLSA